MEQKLPQANPQDFDLEQNPHHHAHGHNHSEGSSCKCGRKHPSCCQMLKGPQRVLILYSILSGMYCQGIYMSNPAFMMICSFYEQCKQMLTQYPTQIFYQFQASCSKQNRIIRSIIGSLVLPFAFLLYYNEHHIITKYVNFLKYGNNDLFYNLLLAIIAIVISNAIMCVILDPGYVDQQWNEQKIAKLLKDKENQINPHRVMCHVCRVPKVVRSQHCEYCNRCVLKFEKHSTLFNHCIGARNHIFYFFFRFGLMLLFLTNLIVLTRDKTVKYRKTDILTIFFFFYDFYMFFSSMKETLLNFVLIGHNFMSVEVMLMRRLPYLWKNTEFEFYNPFDKGLIHNFIESCIPFFSTVFCMTKEVKQDDDKNTQLQDIEPKYSEIQQDEEGNQIQIGDSGNSNEEANTLAASEHESNEKPGKYINWLTAKFITILDIPNHPMQSQAKKEMAQMAQLKQNMPTPEQQQQLLMKKMEEFQQFMMKTCDNNLIQMKDPNFISVSFQQFFQQQLQNSQNMPQHELGQMVHSLQLLQQQLMMQLMQNQYQQQQPTQQQQQPQQQQQQPQQQQQQPQQQQQQPQQQQQQSSDLLQQQQQQEPQKQQNEVQIK